MSINFSSSDKNGLHLVTSYQSGMGKFSKGIQECISMIHCLDDLIELSQKEKDTLIYATELSDIGKFGHIALFNEDSNFAMRMLYSYDVVKSYEEKNISLSTFVDTDLASWYQNRQGGKTVGEDLQPYFNSLYREPAFEAYRKETGVDYQKISLREAWSLYHIITGNTIWKDIAQRNPDNDIGPKAIQIAALHHLLDGVNLHRQDTFLADDMENNAKLIAIMIIIDKIQALLERTALDDKNISESLTIPPRQSEYIHPAIRAAFEKYKDILKAMFLRRGQSDRRNALTLQKAANRVAAIQEEERRGQSDRRNAPKLQKAANRVAEILHAYRQGE